MFESNDSAGENVILGVVKFTVDVWDLKVDVADDDVSGALE